IALIRPLPEVPVEFDVPAQVSATTQGGVPLSTSDQQGTPALWHWNGQIRDAPDQFQVRSSIAQLGVDGRLTVRGEFSAITLEEHSLGRSEGDLLVPTAQPLLGEPAALVISQGRSQTDHQLIAVVTGQLVMMLGDHSFGRKAAG